MRRLFGALAPLAALGVIAGCGGSSSGSTEERVYDRSEVVKHLGLNDYYYTAPGGQRCEVATVMTSAAQVKMYAEAGDVVATNPSGTAGVKIVDPEAKSCQQALTKALQDLN